MSSSGPHEPAASAVLEDLLAGGAPTSPAGAVEAMGLWERPRLAPGRVRLLLNMVSTADGRASLAGLSGPISAPADRELFHALRAAVDAVLVGSGTVTAERYGRIIKSAAVRTARSERGMAAEPLACIVSGRLGLSGVPLLEEPDARVAVLTGSSGEIPPCAASVEYVRAPGPQGLDLRAALAQLRERMGVHTVLCEGGPGLAGTLARLGLIDELLLSLSPVLGGGDSGGAALRILGGEELDPPAQLQLTGALRSGSNLFLRYSLEPSSRASPATILSSSLAS